MPQQPSQLVTQLLVRWKAGDQGALEELVPLVYKELRDIDRHHLRRERPEHTLQSAALVHQACLRLLDQRPFDTENRVHFLAVASRLMRQILVDHARSHGAAKRGADRRVELDTSIILSLKVARNGLVPGHGSGCPHDLTALLSARDRQLKDAIFKSMAMIYG